MEKKVDAYFLLSEYLKVYPYLSKADGESKALTKDIIIRVQRIYALIKAYEDAEKEARGKEINSSTASRKVSNNKKIEAINNFFKFTIAKGAKISEEDLTAVSRKIEDLFKRSPLYDGIQYDCQMLKLSTYRFGMLQLLMELRLKSAEFCQMFDKYSHSSATSLPFKTASMLYFANMHQSDKKVEEIIVGLMGSIYKKSFSKEELVQKYEYPTETDQELDDFCLRF